MGIDESTLFSIGGGTHTSIFGFYLYLFCCLFILLLDKWDSFPEPTCCDTNLRSSLVTCLLPRIFRNI